MVFDFSIFNPELNYSREKLQAIAVVLKAEVNRRENMLELEKEYSPIPMREYLNLTLKILKNKQYEVGRRLEALT